MFNCVAEIVYFVSDRGTYMCQVIDPDDNPIDLIGPRHPIAA
ncbi:MAG: hypothetical protein ACRC62_31075 [Microcoleus sp.]